MGWALFAVVLTAWALTWVIAAHLTEDEVFDRIVDLANVYAAAFGALALVLVAVDRFQATRGVLPTDEAVAAAEQSLARAVRRQERLARTYLLGADRKQAQAVNLRFRVHGTGEIGSLSTVTDLYRREGSGRLLITGGAGTGKTVLAAHLLLQLVRDREPGEPVPVRFSLSAFDPAVGIDGWLSKQLAVKFNLDERMATELVARRRILPVLDGLDEVSTPGGRDAPAGGVLTEINTYMVDDELAPVIVTYRSDSDDRVPALVGLRIEMLALDTAAVINYLRDRAAEDPLLLAATEELVQMLNQATSGSRNLSYALRTPWLLTLALTALRAGVAPGELASGTNAGDGPAAGVVERRLLAYYVFAATRLHDSQDDPAAISRWLRSLAVYLADQQRNNRSGTDIQLHGWWRSAGERRIRVAHGLLAAVAVLVSIGASLMTFLGRSSVVADRPLRYTTDLDRLEPAFAIAAIVVVVGAVVLPWLAGRTAGQADPQPSRAGLRHLRTRIGRRRFAGVTVAGVIAGLAGGLVVGSGVGLGSGLSVGLTFGVLYGVTGGAIVGTAFGIAVGLNRGLADAVTPGQIIRGDLLHGMTYGLLVGVASGVSGATAIGTTYGLAVGVGSALVYGMAIGPVASVRYAVAVTFSALGGRSPLRLHRFLKWASDAGILRVSGVVYQFRHRELQRWFEMTGPGADYRSADSGAQTADVRGVDGVHKAP